MAREGQKLFREMFQKASNEVGFEAEDIPLMVEAIPLSSESIMLVITKIGARRRAGYTLSQFSPFTEDKLNPLPSQLASEFLEGAENPLNYLEPDSGGGTGDPSDNDAKKKGCCQQRPYIPFRQPGPDQ